MRDQRRFPGAVWADNGPAKCFLGHQLIGQRIQRVRGGEEERNLPRRKMAGGEWVGRGGAGHTSRVMVPR